MVEGRYSCVLRGNHALTARRRYLVTYDISDDRRRSRVFEACRQQGDHTQFSVFVAELDDRELVRFQAQLSELIHQHEDQILIADLGPACRGAGQIIASLGRAYELPTRVIVV